VALVIGAPIRVEATNDPSIQRTLAQVGQALRTLEERALELLRKEQ
jgi:hypothetical protein